MAALPDGYILWDLASGNEYCGRTPLLFSGNIDEVSERVNGSGRISGYILSFKALDEFLYQFPDNARIILTYIENTESLTKEPKTIPDDRF